jgi:uncharacterized protein
LNVLVAGGTGFVGRRLCATLVARGDVVTVVSRDPSGARAHGQAGVSYRGWLPALDAYDAVVNVAGENIFARRWNDEVKRALRSSRVDSTRRIVEAFAAAHQPPRVLVNASAVGFYGDRGNEELREDAAPGDDVMAQLCRAWEAEALRCPARTIVMRFGIVLGEDGGALATMLPIFRLGLGGPIGLGRQWFPWIHGEDLAALIVRALDDERFTGPVNAVSPGLVRNAKFTSALGRALHRPTFFPVPPLALRLKFGQVAQVLTGSQRCVPQAAQTLGFTWRHGEIGEALSAVLAR